MPVNTNLTGKKVFADEIQKRSYRTTAGLESSAGGVIVKKGGGGRGTEAHTCEAEAACKPEQTRILLY